MEIGSNYIYKCSFVPEIQLSRPKAASFIVVICEYADLDDVIENHLLKDEVGFFKKVVEKNVLRQVSRRDVEIVELGPAYVKSGVGVVCKG